MTRFDYWKCDECGKILENVECSPNQLMYTLVANYDTGKGLGFPTENMSYKANFCSSDCLKKYVNSKVSDHHDLPIVSDENRPKESITLGEIYEEKGKQ